MDVISSIVGDSSQEISLVLEKYSELVKDRTYLVPVIGSISELPLKEDMKVCRLYSFNLQVKNKVFELATEALQIADETDIPTITRTLLRTITKGI